MRSAASPHPPTRAKESVDQGGGGGGGGDTEGGEEEKASVAVDDGIGGNGSVGGDEEEGETDEDEVCAATLCAAAFESVAHSTAAGGERSDAEAALA